MTDPVYRPAADPASTVEVHRVHEDRGSGAGRIFAIVAVLALAGVVAAWAAGLFTVETDGALKAPEVNIEGGQLPSVDVDAADVEVGTTTATVEVPTVEVTKPE